MSARSFPAPFLAWYTRQRRQRVPARVRKPCVRRRPCRWPTACLCPRTGTCHTHRLHTRAYCQALIILAGRQSTDGMPNAVDPGDLRREVPAGERCRSLVAPPVGALTDVSVISSKCSGRSKRRSARLHAWFPPPLAGRGATKPLETAWASPRPARRRAGRAWVRRGPSTAVLASAAL